MEELGSHLKREGESSFSGSTISYPKGVSSINEFFKHGAYYIRTLIYFVKKDILWKIK